MTRFLLEGDVPVEGCCGYRDHGATCACPEHPVSSLHPFGSTGGAAFRITGGPWPERIGCTGRIVEAPPGYNTYPFDKSDPTCVIVVLDDDPLGCDKRGCKHAEDDVFSCNQRTNGPAWSCNIQRRDVEFL